MTGDARARARRVLLDHQHTYHGGCYCGWLGSDDSYADHVLDALEAAGIRLTLADERG